MPARLLALLLVLPAAASAATAAQPRPLRGVPLTGSTGLRLLVANDPPFLLDADTGRVRTVTGFSVRDQPVLSVLALGSDAIVWVDRRAPVAKPQAAEIYAVRHGTTVARRIGTGWDVAPAADGTAVWLKSYLKGGHCTLLELGLDGRARRSPEPVPCTARLVNSGSGALLSRGGSLADPLTGRTVLHSGNVLAIAGHFALGNAGSKRPLPLTDLRSGKRRLLPWPSRIAYMDEAVVQPGGRLIAVSFADPAYQGSGTQVTDVWLLDPVSGTFRHLPDMPADVALKFTSMSWTNDDRLVWLAETGRRNVVAVWRPGERRIAVRPVRIPDRNSGSDSFVVFAR